MGKINVAIIGVGNCASSLVQGVHYYRNALETEFVPGLMHVNLGGYHISDINFVAAFDIDKNKVGKDLAQAIYTKPNNVLAGVSYTCPTNEWVHLAVVRYSALGNEFFANGVSLGTVNLATEQVMKFQLIYGDSYGLVGDGSDAGIWSRAISDSELSLLASKSAAADGYNGWIVTPRRWWPVSSGGAPPASIIPQVMHHRRLLGCS